MSTVLGLFELITKKKAIYIDSLNKKKVLTHTYILMFHQKVRDILDNYIIEDEAMLVLEILAELGMLCLSPRGDERPTMKEVAERLQTLSRI